MHYSLFFSIAMISLLGAMSPGPDFAVVTKNCLTGDFRRGFYATLGVSSALLVHVSYCLLGVALLIQQSPLVFTIIKYLGAAYLFYLGVGLLREKVTGEITQGAKMGRNPFLSGFLCNLLNPKATIFILSLFTQLIDPSLGTFEKAMLGTTISIVSLIWFSLLSFFLTHRLLQKHMVRFQAIITKVMGVALCLLALYVFF